MSSLAVLGLIVSSYAFSAPTTVTGKISYAGASSAEVIKMNADPVCAKEHAGKPVHKEDVEATGGGLANVFIYVKEGVKKDGLPPAPATAVDFDQRGCQYHPHVMGLRVGQSLKIINSDPTMHNVHVMAKSNPAFNMGMPNKGQTVEKKFTKPEVMVKVKCDVHGWMNAYIGVVDHPFFAVSDASGTFNIAGLPPGDYTIEAWHEKLGAKTEKVTVTDAGGTKNVDFKF
jgi:plastocyanin